MIVDESINKKGIKQVIIDQSGEKKKNSKKVEIPVIKNQLLVDDLPTKNYDYKLSYLDFIKKTQLLTNNSKQTNNFREKPKEIINSISTNNEREKKNNLQRKIKYSQMTYKNNRNNHVSSGAIKEITNVKMIEMNYKLNGYNRNNKDVSRYII